MDPRELTLFFADRLEHARQSLNVDPFLAEALLQNLRRDLFELTHQALFAQYQLLAATVRYEEFAASLGSPEIRSHIFHKFPSLHPLMELTVQRFLKHAQSFIRDFSADCGLIQKHFFNSSEPLQIHSVRFGLGDTHDFGRSVTAVEFLSGEKIIYKPRSLACDDAFSRISEWFNARSPIQVKIPMHLNCGDHGWVEWIDPLECCDNPGVERYYQRSGALLSLLHACGATDFHYENLIAHGEYPVPIDLETLFRPEQDLPQSTDLLRRSVLACGLLPHEMPSAPGKRFEAGGLSDVEGQAGLWASLSLVRDGQGQLQWRQGTGRLTTATNLPRVHGQKVQLQGPFIESFIRGFHQGYDVFLTQRKEFLQLLDAMPDFEVRVLFRNTAAYAAILRNSKHPLVLQDPSGFESLIQKIPAHELVRTQEIQDMSRLDVPHFTSRIRGCDLYQGGRFIAEGTFLHSGLETTRRRIESFDNVDRQNQIRIIESVLRRGRMKTNSSENVSLCETANGIAQWLAEQAVVTSETATWIVQRNLTPDGEQRLTSLAPCDLAQGLAGIILFLQEWTNCNQDTRFQPVILKAIQACEDLTRSQDLPLGLFTGWGGLLFMYNRLYLLTRNKRYAQRIIDLIVRIEPLVSTDVQYSVVNGAAGLILACTEIHRTMGYGQALALAQVAASHLLQHATRTEDGLTWQTVSSRPLAGLSHGASGFALAFGRMFRATGDVRFAESAKSCLAFERTLFVASEGNWEDRRDTVRNTAFSTGWSHGAPGIGMVRDALMACGLDSPELQMDLEAAYACTVAKGFGRAAHLAMGDFGNLELLLRLSRITPVLVEQALTRVSMVQGPGYLGGLAGVGHQCLRLLHPNLVPSILLGEVTPDFHAASKALALPNEFKALS